MPGEFPTAFAAATRVPLYPSDAHAWDVHNGAAVSPTMHLLPVTKRLEDMVGGLFVDFVKIVDSNYAAMLERAEALRAEFSSEVGSFSASIGERLGVIETVLDGKLSEELDPVFTKWLGGMSFAPANAQPNVIETVKVNGKPLNVVSKSVDVTVPDAYPKSETDAMLDEKADRLGEWIVDPPSVSLVWVDADHPHPSAPDGATGWWPDSQGAVKGDRDSTELHWAEGSEAPMEVTAVRKAVLYTGDAHPNVIETVKVDGVPLHVSDDKSVDIRSTGMISDSAGNVVRADGSAVVVDGSWTCNGVVLTQKEGRDDYWENAERHWGLGYDPSAKWAFTNGSGYARLDAPADATKLSFVIGGVTYDATVGRADSVVMAGDVVPKGSGTETIATIGGKDIKAPASPVSSVNGKTGDVKLVAADVGALALGSSNKVGSLFSMNFEGEETSGGNILFGVGMGPGGWTFVVNKFYCSDRLYANGFVITNTSGAPGESVLNRIQEYGGDFKTALDEVNGLVDTTKRYSVVRPEASGNAYQLSDFAVNVVDLPSSGEYTFTFPPRTGGRVRDFVLKLNVTADPLPTVQFVKHPTDSDPPRFEGADGWSELELGVNFFGFTETS